MEQFQFRQSTSQQNYVPTLPSDDHRHLRHDAMIWHIRCDIIERELCVHCGLSTRLNEQTFYICNCDMQMNFP
jgi:hypothetical protein